MYKQDFISDKARVFVALVLLSTITFIAGCATTNKNASLEHAKGVVADVKNDPATMKNESAVDYLAQADEALAKSKHTDDSIRFFRTDDDPKDVDHWAYIAEQKALMAKTAAQGDKDKAELAKLKSELDQAMLAKKDKEAAEAKRLEEDRLAQEALQRQREAEMQAALQRAEQSGAEIERSAGEIKVTFRNVTFETNKADLKREFKAELADLAELLIASQPDAKVIVRGHTDATGPEEYNQMLSEKRAVSVKTFLIQQGVELTRVTSEGLGQSSPVASNDSREGRAKNRRVELIIKE